MALSTIKKATLMLLAVLAAALVLSACNTTGTDDNDTAKTSNGTEYAYITNYDKSDGTITIDKVEWITRENTSRINELDLDVNKDFTNGYYVYNADKDDLKTYDLADNVVVVTRNDNTTSDAADDIAEDRDNNNGTNNDGTTSNTTTSNNTTTTNNTANPTSNDTVNDAVQNTNDATNDLLASISDMIGVNQSPFKITIKDDKVTRIEEAYYTTTTNNNTTTNNTTSK